jgi:hypothetical protein
MVVANGADGKVVKLLALQAWHEILCDYLQRGEVQHTSLSAHFIFLRWLAEMVAVKCVGAEFHQLQSSRALLKLIVADLLASPNQQPDIFDTTLVQDAIQHYCEATETFFTTKTELLEVLDVMSSLVLDNDDGENRGNHDDLSIEIGGGDSGGGDSTLYFADTLQIGLTAESESLQVFRQIQESGRHLDEKLLTSLHQVLARTDHLHVELAKRCRMIQNHASKAVSLCLDMVAYLQFVRDLVHTVMAERLPSGNVWQELPLLVCLMRSFWSAFSLLSIVRMLRAT